MSDEEIAQAGLEAVAEFERQFGPIPEFPAGLSGPYVKIWFRMVTEERKKGVPLHKAIWQVNHDIGVHDGIHDRMK